MQHLEQIEFIRIVTMGCVLSEEQKQAIEATKVSKQINKSIQEDYKRSLKEVKFLLLGKF